LSEDIRLTRLAVTICRDRNWTIRKDLLRLVRDDLLYVGAPISDIRNLEKNNTYEPIGLFHVLNYLNIHGLLSDFLTQVLRHYRPVGINAVALVEHLEPLGLDWDRKSNQIRPATTHPEAERIIRAELRNLLAGVGGPFPDMLEGAWRAYYSDNPDKYRQTIASCRELLNQVTTSLSSGHKLERKERIRLIMGKGHRADVVEAVGELIEAIYGAQSAQEHTTPDKTTALFVLVETEHILYYVLTNKK
jgi:hypothetical protein